MRSFKVGEVVWFDTVVSAFGIEIGSHLAEVVKFTKDGTYAIHILNKHVGKWVQVPAVNLRKFDKWIDEPTDEYVEQLTDWNYGNARPLS